MCDILTSRADTKGRASGPGLWVLLSHVLECSKAEAPSSFSYAATMTLYADLCVRLQNASRAKLKSVPIPYTKANVAISAILLQHGFIYNMTRGSIAGPSAVDWNTAPDVRKRLWIDLKYRADDRPVLERMNLVSKPSRHLSMTKDELLLWETGRPAKLVTPIRTGDNL